MNSQIRDRITGVLAVRGLSSPSCVYLSGTEIGYNWNQDSVAMAMRSMARDGLLETDGVHYALKAPIAMSDMPERRIVNKDLKLRVLRKLSKLVKDDIGRVLLDVAGDLRAAR